MKAAVVRAFGRPLSIEEVNVPMPGPGQVLVKVVASGVCHTDLHAADGDWPVKPPGGAAPGSFELPIFDVVLNAKTVRGSIVGARLDLAEALQFAGDGKAAAHYTTDRIENINTILGAMKQGSIEGRVVLQI